MIRKIVNAEGTIIFEARTGGPQVFPPSVCWITSDILAKTMDEGTGAGARRAGFTAPAYGKTGTTNDYKDAWFVGYTDKVTTGVWVGLDQPARIMDKGYGSTLALPVWTEVMKTAEESGFAAAKLPTPPNTSPTLLCRGCGGVAGNRTPNPYQMDLPAEMRPRFTCRGHGPGLFTGGMPQAIPIPGEQRPQEESGIGNAIRNFGRRIFGGRR